jgi:hypothetical protein
MVGVRGLGCLRGCDRRHHLVARARIEVVTSRPHRVTWAAAAWACFAIAATTAGVVWDLNSNLWFLTLVALGGFTAATIITIWIKGANPVTNPPTPPSPTTDGGAWPPTDAVDWWTSSAYAVVADTDTISVIRSPGDRSDDDLRARVNASEFAVVIRQAGTDPDFTIPDWPCDICGAERLFDQISVAHPTASFAPGVFQVRLRYCNDRPACTEVATTIGQWPPPQAGDLCIPALKLHATPHRGCVLR